MISPVYTNKGVSRYDPGSRCYRCCHCDGLAFLSYIDKYNATAQLPSNKDETDRILAESGNAYQLDYKQFIHYRCGVYVGQGRHIKSEDLDLIAQTKEMTKEFTDTILSHYLLTKDDIMKRFIQHNEKETVFDDIYSETVVINDDLKNKLKIKGDNPDDFNLFNPDDINAIHQRIYIKEEDLETFKSANRNSVYIPPMDDPSVEQTLNYRHLRNEQPQCVRCDAQLTAHTPGLQFIHNRAVLYVHFTCYDIIVKKREENDRHKLYEQFDSQEKKRLKLIEEKWGYLPVREYMEWYERVKKPVAGSWEYKIEHDQFLQFYENRLKINQ